MEHNDRDEPEISLELKNVKFLLLKILKCNIFMRREHIARRIVLILGIRICERNS